MGEIRSNITLENTVDRGVCDRGQGQETDIRRTTVDGMVDTGAVSLARSEAHDSGLCAADSATRRRFATDLLNLTLAGPRVNRYQKVDHDAAEWLPSQNRCWFAARAARACSWTPARSCSRATSRAAPRTPAGTARRRRRSSTAARRRRSPAGPRHRGRAARWRPYRSASCRSARAPRSRTTAR